MAAAAATMLLQQLPCSKETHVFPSVGLRQVSIRLLESGIPVAVEEPKKL